ncbi:unnamed protein product, partial [Medioppia subpectinata]
RFVRKFLSAIDNDPAEDLAKDPCYAKSYLDADKCVAKKVPDYDPECPFVEYRCCILWLGLDCLRDAGKTDCTAPEAETMGTIEDQMIAFMNENQCETYKYVKDIKICKI